MADYRSPPERAAPSDVIAGLEELRALRSQLSDMAALLALPAMWRGREPSETATSLLGVLVSILRLDLAYLRLDQTNSEPAIEAWRPDFSGPPRELADIMEARLAGGEAIVIASEKDPTGSNPLRVAGLSLERTGLVIVGSRRTDFPSELERFLFAVAVEQAVIAIGVARSLGRERVARAEAEAERARLRSLFTQAPAAIALLKGPEHVFEVANSQYAKIVGQRNFIGRTIREVLPELTGQGIFELLDRVYASGEAYTGSEIPVKLDQRGDGIPEEGFFNFVYQPICDTAGRVEAIFVHAVDVTEQVRARQRVEVLAAENARLYHETQDQMAIQVQLNAALQETAKTRDRALAELQQLLRTRDEFVSTVAHDLKNPLTSIKGWAQLLHRQLTRGRTISPDTLEQTLSNIEVLSNQTIRQVEELVEIAKLQLGSPLSLDKSPTDLCALAGQLVGAMQQTTATHHIDLESAVPQLIGTWDELRIRRVLGNLLDNALKYSPGGGAIIVRIEQREEQSVAWAVLSVHDEGVGIPASDLPHIFDPFRRGGISGTSIPGQGIGLASARQIIEQHGGTITAESREGCGSTFTIRLPV